MTDTTYHGFAADKHGYVDGALPPGMSHAEHSGQIQAAGFDVVVEMDRSAVIVCGDEKPEADQIHLRDWRPEPPVGDGWTLAWRAQSEDGEANVVWWRPRQGETATHEIFDAF